jgi:predicted acetyltransferase
MKTTLRKLSTADEQDIFQMLQTIPAEENGFYNIFHGLSFREFKRALTDRVRKSQGIGVEEGFVPDTHYWFYVGDQPAGWLKIRHYLTDALREEGGHIGYAMAPGFRGQGLAIKMLKLGIERARQDHEIEEILITIKSGNLASRKVAEKAGAILTNQSAEICYYRLK